ncbi:MAG: bifunctional DNA primase/polymerase [Cyanobacteriota bacterium]|nr:bifunctional DNA primase/polymerase [Cyanobacteriota bacterium]
MVGSSELALLPPHWRLVPVMGKRPLGKQWQNHAHSPQQMLAWLERGSVPVWGKNGLYAVRPTGYGLLCGQTGREYLIAVDCDGYEAHKELARYLKSWPPATVAFSSGRPGRCQYLFSFPSGPGKLKSRKIACEAGETLELRGENHVSVLPPSPHPVTGQYRWIQGCRPDQIGVARAPEGIAQLMRPIQPNARVKAPSLRHPTPERRRSDITPSSYPPTTTTITQAQSLLWQIHPRFADEYYPWVFVGMALKSIDYGLLWDWDRWSAQSHKYQPGETEYKWKTFQKTGITERYLWWLAKQF